MSDLVTPSSGGRMEGVVSETSAKAGTPPQSTSWARRAEGGWGQAWGLGPHRGPPLYTDLPPVN